MKFLNIKSFAFGALFLGLAQTSAMGFTLDAFTEYNNNDNLGFTVDGQQAQVNGFGGIITPSPDTDTDLNINLVFSGQRTISVSDLNNSEEDVNFKVFDGNASLSVGSSTIGGAEIIWDGYQGSTANFVDIQELDNGNPTQFSFQINVDSLDIGDDINENPDELVLGFEIQDTSGNSANITQSITQNVSLGNSQSFYFPYQNRVESTIDNGGNVNLQQINYIRFYTDSENVGDDFNFSFIQSSEVVPFEFSPSLGLILGSSLFGFLKLQKKLKKRQF